MSQLSAWRRHVSGTLTPGVRRTATGSARPVSAWSTPRARGRGSKATRYCTCWQPCWPLGETDRSLPGGWKARVLSSPRPAGSCRSHRAASRDGGRRPRSGTRAARRGRCRSERRSDRPATPRTRSPPGEAVPLRRRRSNPAVACPRRRCAVNRKLLAVRQPDPHQWPLAAGRTQRPVGPARLARSSVALGLRLEHQVFNPAGLQDSHPGSPAGPGRGARQALTTGPGDRDRAVPAAGVRRRRRRPGLGPGRRPGAEVRHQPGAAGVAGRATAPGR